ncbi:MAG: menaquinone-specific isochorismate synthase [Actinomycetota bacterium]|nr:menaquinone-specific isochorismate synthase [Actinomycetota bacterium]
MSGGPTTVWLPAGRHLDLAAVAGDDGFLFEREGVGLAATGLDRKVAATDASRLVASLGPDAMAVGALPFRRAELGWLAVPELIVRRRADGAVSATTTDGRAPLRLLEAVLGRAADRDRQEEPDAFSLTSSMSHADWRHLVEAATKEIDNGHFDKVVLAREVEVMANRPIVLGPVIDRLRALYPSCTTFAVDGFVGASPELLVSRVGHDVRSHPLAGTVARSGDPEVDRRVAEGLLASAKDRAEHRLVVEAVAEVLAAACDELIVPPAPSIVSLRNVVHLGTEISGRLRHPSPSALELALALHPTPAVGGTPTDVAVTYLDDEEGLDRGRYAGPVGWVDGHGDGEWVVGIRSADIDGARARLRAGVGIVAGSDAEAELAETQLKLQALLSAVVRP